MAYRQNPGASNVDQDVNAADFSSDMDRFPIAMAYVPWQKWQKICDPEAGLMAGTIFAELNKPYTGKRGTRL